MRYAPVLLLARAILFIKHTAHESLVSRAMLAEVLLAGLSLRPSRRLGCIRNQKTFKSNGKPNEI